VGSSVTRGTQKHRVSKGQQAAKADKQVEGASKKRKTHDLHQKDRVDPNRCNRKKGKHQHKCKPK
jgi:hypothetical protein